MNDAACLRQQLLVLARYNAWASRRLFAAVDALGEDDYRRELGLFFGSIHRTLNHLLVGEHELWFARFARGQSPRIALDAEIEPDRARLRDRLLTGALNWAPFIEGVSPEQLAGQLDYTSSRGEPQSLPFVPTLIHVFNHGTHHRGQITAALTALGQTAPELDLVYLLVEEKAPPSSARKSQS
ncbi:MAG: DinB family protein [Burkholderiaceae bacterium]